MKGTKLDLKRAAIEGDTYRANEEYTDKVECVPMALGALIVMFVEDEHDGPEKLEEHINWRIQDAANSTDKITRGSQTAWIAAEERILQLYNWWTKTRPELMKREKDLLHQWADSKCIGDRDFLDSLNAPDTPDTQRLFEAHSDLKDRIRAEMQEFCHGVVEVREYMWT